MGKCMKCGNYMPWDTGICTSCREAAAREHAKRYQGEGDYFTRIKKQQEQRNKQPCPESPTIRYTANGYFKKKWYRNGDLYSGTMKDGYRHGKGKWTRATDKYTYDGDWYMSKRHGHGKEEMPGKWRFEGEFYDNKRNGFGKLVCTDGFTYEGEWQADKKQGYGKGTFASGNRYEGEWFNGNRHGKGTYYNAAKNETYDGEWKDDKLNGNAVVRYADGRIYEGSFIDNSKTGNGKEIAPDGTVTFGHWEGNSFVVDSVLHGEDTENAAGEQHEPTTPVPIPDTPLSESEESEPEKKEFDMSPESLADFIKSNAASGDVSDSKQAVEGTAPSVKLMPDFQKHFAFFDGILYAIDRNGVLHVTGGLKKKSEIAEMYNGRENVTAISFCDHSNIIILGGDGNVIFADSTWKKGLLADKEMKAQLPEAANWSGLSDVACGTWQFVGLRPDGTVIGAGKKMCHLGELSGWTDIKAVACGEYGTVGLRTDGTVLSCGYPNSVAKELAGWTDIISVACGHGHIVGLRSDGTAVACGKDKSGYCNVGSFRNIGIILAGNQCTVLIFNDGTVKALGKYHAASLYDCGVVGAVYSNFGRIISLDNNGSLHGDIYGIDLTEFTKDFKW